MVTEAARTKLVERIATARRLGGLYQAEAAGMMRALVQMDAAAEVYVDVEQRAAYVRGYRDAQEIIQVETQVAAMVALRGF